MARTLDIIYDIEVFNNIFTFVSYNPHLNVWLSLEVSPRRNDFAKFISAMNTYHRKGCTMVGFNNMHYDYPVIHELLHRETERRRMGANPFEWWQICRFAKSKSNKIIDAPDNERFTHVIWSRDQHVKQMDLMKIHHFDNKARMTSLKMLEVNMRSQNFQELPFDPNEDVPISGMQDLIDYNKFDVDRTHAFYKESKAKIQLRDQLAVKYNRDFTNHNDTKIGKDIFIHALESNGVRCFKTGNGKREPVQTFRKVIKMEKVVMDVPFKRPEFIAVRDWIKRQKIKETKGVFTDLELETLGDVEFFCNMTTVKRKVYNNAPRVKNLNCVVDGFEFVFGTGGLHGCIHTETVRSDEEYLVVDLDVVSYYPSLAIANNVYPAHLGESFVEVYRQLKSQRVSYAKGTPENAALKLALNGVYGDSNNKFSPFYDPKYTMTITVNGQLLLCLLAEWLLEIEGLSMVQANTDGVTVKCPRKSLDVLDAICKRWEKFTRLALERADYNRMFVADVNNYVSEYTDGKFKRKGRYEFENLDWHKNNSHLICKRAAFEHMTKGVNIREFIESSLETHPFEFYGRTKVPRSSRLELHTLSIVNGEAQNQIRPLQRISRYYVSRDGGSLVKVMPPLKKNPNGAERKIGIEKGYKVTIHNMVAPIDPETVDFDYYVAETEKLVNGLV